ncbi:hypothetical protein J3E74DRAFT_386860, partial [Bipolaris maydis]
MSISTYLMHHCIRLLYFVLLFFMSHNYPLAAVCTRDCTSALYEHLCQHLSTGAFVQHLYFNSLWSFFFGLLSARLSQVPSRHVI